ncbi:MAG: UDP-N-acetylmuramate:L-alanyl-gamma-D-glutamyl-meso-diaminopimelate ligase [Verrucomicrobiae bacterium]|nr:UDP-N-acetylmuramate:L-alanyl-gamma-D-glutamyl-meso-diaminopimelate ligase [Verrucomicrobiae bacterium]
MSASEFSSGPRRFHFIGICGTAMGAVAGAMKRRGYEVTGSDASVYPPMSTYLESTGIKLSSGYDAANIPADTDVIVVGNAISRGNPEAEQALRSKALYISMPEILKQYFLRGKRNLVVTGTHGKTTTTTLLTWILKNAGADPGYLIGGIPKNFDGGANFTDSDFVVLEGDEYDTAFFDKRSKFLHYLPEVAIINNIEFDHADIYDNLDQILLTFSRLLRIVPDNGCIFANGDDANCRKVVANSPSPVVTVGLGESCDLRITEIRYSAEGSYFKLGGTDFLVPMDGQFNVRNAAMAIAAARFAGFDDATIRSGLESFTGIARRQEVRGEVRGIKIIDDFGHHPTAILQAAEALKRRYPEGRLWAVFEPRSNTTRRAIFQQDLVAALAEADGAIVAAVPDPAKFAPEDRLNPQQLVADVNARGTESYFEDGVDAIIDRLKPLVKEGDTIVVFSNGGFDGIHGKLLERL